MSSAEFRELNPVLERPQESIGIGEGLCLASANVAALAERLDCRDCVALPHGVIGTTVNQLEQLNRELHVAKTARAEFDLTIDLIGR